MEGVLNDSFKQADGDFGSGFAEVGHYMPLIAEVHPTYTSE